MSLDRLASAQGSVRANVLHVSIVGQNVVIWLEFELYPPGVAM
jgi:hypothetical protein